MLTFEHQQKPRSKGKLIHTVIDGSNSNSGDGEDARSLALSSWSIMMLEEEEENKNDNDMQLNKIGKMKYFLKQLLGSVCALLFGAIVLIAFGIICYQFFTFEKTKQVNQTDETMSATDLLNGTIAGLNLTVSEEQFNLTTTTQEPMLTTKISMPEYCLANFGNNSWNPPESSESAVLFNDALTVVNLQNVKTEEYYSYDKRFLYTNVRAREAFSLIDALLLGNNNAHRRCRPVFYFELLIRKNKNQIIFGLASESFKFSSNSNWLGNEADSFSIETIGSLWQSGNKQQSFGVGFGEGDVIGCGLLFLVQNRQLRRQLFFTKNGHIYGKPVWLPKKVGSSLYPTVTLVGKGTAVEANFGANLTLKPFRYDLVMHDAAEHREQTSKQG